MPVVRPADVVWILHSGFVISVRRVARPNRCCQVVEIAVNDLRKIPISIVGVLTTQVHDLTQGSLYVSFELVFATKWAGL